MVRKRTEPGMVVRAGNLLSRVPKRTDTSAAYHEAERRNRRVRLEERIVEAALADDLDTVRKLAAELRGSR